MKAETKVSTSKRSIAILAVLGLFASYLLFTVFRLSVFMNEYYREKAYEQITTSSVLKAERGAIYDSNMNLLAGSGNVFRIFVSPREISLAERESGGEYGRLIANALGDILSLDKDAIYNKISNSSLLDVTVKKAASKEEYERVLGFISEMSLERLVFTEAETSRYYPEGTLAAHALGFTGSDNQGLYGLEYQYNDILSGKDGYYVYAKDANGIALDTEYSSYSPAQNGQSLVTTIDSYIQSELEAIITRAEANHGAQNRVCGIVMDTKTGAILAMATTRPFDPNSPFQLDELSLSELLESGYAEGSEEYKKLKTELMQVMWSNKAVSEIYEPGSTFKIVTVSAALDAGATTLESTFSCKGYAEVGGWKIRCHKAGGHGSGFPLSYGLQMSCNPCMIAISEKLGSESFYSYVKSFGLLEKTGIDLPSEATAIFHKPESIGPTELATASFGQRFKVSIINQLTAIAAVANGGELVTPYLVDKIISEDGSITYEHKTEAKRRVVSKEVADAVSKILIDGVNGSGGAKNAGVAGYDIAAKTGTSQKFDILDENGNSYLRIGSTVAYSTDSDSGIAAIIVVDEPSSQVKYGSVVAAPYISELMEKALPYLEFKSNEVDQLCEIGSYVGLTADAAKEKAKDDGIGYSVVGNGTTVIGQCPANGEYVLAENAKVILYTEKADDSVRVPSFVGMKLTDAVKLAIDTGLNVRLGGGSAIGTDTVTYQSLPPETVVTRGAAITLRAPSKDFED